MRHKNIKNNIIIIYGYKEKLEIKDSAYSAKRNGNLLTIIIK